MHPARIRRLPLAASLLLAITGGLAGQGAPAGSFTPLPRPTLIIGREGEPDYEFVFVTVAERRANGEVVVVDRRAQSVRIFDRRGELVRTLGREGAGPGEFRGISSLFLAGDTRIAFDPRQMRLTRYLASGALVGTQQVLTSANDGRMHIAGRFASGQWPVARCGGGAPTATDLTGSWGPLHRSCTESDEGGFAGAPTMVPFMTRR